MLGLSSTMLVKGAPGIQVPNYKSDCQSFLSMISLWHRNLKKAMAKSEFHSFKWSNVPRYLLYRVPASFFFVGVRRLQILWQYHDYKHNAMLCLHLCLIQYLCQWPRLFPWPKLYLCLWPALSHFLWLFLKMPTYTCDQPYHTAFGYS